MPPLLLRHCRFHLEHCADLFCRLLGENRLEFWRTGILLAHLFFAHHHHLVGQRLDDQGVDGGTAGYSALVGRAGRRLRLSAVYLWQLQLDGQHLVHSAADRPICHSRNHRVLPQKSATAYQSESERGGFGLF